MKRAIVVLSLLGGWAAAPPAQAQYAPQMPGYGNIAYTPYVNLLNGNNMNPAVTYQGIIQPQLQAQANFQQLQNQIDLTRTMPGGIAPPRNTGVADTGKVTARFMQYQHYFNTMSGQNRTNYPMQPGTVSARFGTR